MSIIVGGKSNLTLAKNIANLSGLHFLNANTSRFNDGEFKVNLPVDKNIDLNNAFILQSISNPVNDNLIELILLANCLKNLGAFQVTAIIPYLGYSRQDKLFQTGSSVTAGAVAKIIQASGVDRIITIDPHSDNIRKFYDIPFYEIPHLKLYADYIKAEYSNADSNLLIVSPDAGRGKNAIALSKILKTDFIIMSKTRVNAQNVEYNFEGNVEGKTCILIDDIIDSGNTLIKASKVLKSFKAARVTACVTHGVLSLNASKAVNNSYIDKILITDSILNSTLPSKFRVIPIAKLLSSFISNL